MPHEPQLARTLTWPTLRFAHLRVQLSDAYLRVLLSVAHTYVAPPSDALTWTYIFAFT